MPGISSFEHDWRDFPVDVCISHGTAAGGIVSERIAMADRLLKALCQLSLKGAEGISVDWKSTKESVRKALEAELNLMGIDLTTPERLTAHDANDQRDTPAVSVPRRRITRDEADERLPVRGAPPLMASHDVAATFHTLRCNCGKDLAVTHGQAGSTILCACGQETTVPSLRRLRGLPTINASTTRQEHEQRKQNVSLECYVDPTKVGGPVIGIACLAGLILAMATGAIPGAAPLSAVVAAFVFAFLATEWVRAHPRRFSKTVMLGVGPDGLTIARSRISDLPVQATVNDDGRITIPWKAILSVRIPLRTHVNWPHYEVLVPTGKLHFTFRERCEMPVDLARAAVRCIQLQGTIGDRKEFVVCTRLLDHSPYDIAAAIGSHGVNVDDSLFN